MAVVRASRAAVAFAALLAGACTTPAERALARFLGGVERHGGRAGVVVVDTVDGRRLAAHAAEQGFVPASNIKLLTATVALRSFGVDGTLSTQLRHTGAIRGDELRGDLVLCGGGDPTLGLPRDADPRLDALVAAVRARGVRRVAGRVRGDGSWLGPERLGRGWEHDDLGEPFAAPFGGLCCAGNVAPTGGADGVRLAPVADPAAFAAATLRVRLEAAGIVVADGGGFEADGQGEAVGDAASTLLAEVESPTIAALLVPLLADSDNLVAEQLWRAAARHATGNGSSASAAGPPGAALAARGGAPGAPRPIDGSGLSRQNPVRPAQLAALLGVLHDSPWQAELLAALPEAGASGTLRSRFVDGPARGVVFAKTGTLTRVTALSGWLARPRGAPWAFVVLWNDFLCDDDAARAAVDAFVQELATAAGW